MKTTLNLNDQVLCQAKGEVLDFLVILVGVHPC